MEYALGDGAPELCESRPWEYLGEMQGGDEVHAFSITVPYIFQDF